MMQIVVGFVIAFALMGLVSCFTEWLGRARTRADNRKAVDKFCEDRNYCFYGCGLGKEGAYYGGYHCNSDHK